MEERNVTSKITKTDQELYPHIFSHSYICHSHNSGKNDFIDLHKYKNPKCPHNFWFCETMLVESFESFPKMHTKDIILFAHV